MRFDCIEFDGWADSMEKRNFALPACAAKAPAGEGLLEGNERVANHCIL